MMGWGMVLAKTLLFTLSTLIAHLCAHPAGDLADRIAETLKTGRNVTTAQIDEMQKATRELLENQIAVDDSVRSRSASSRSSNSSDSLATRGSAISSNISEDEFERRMAEMLMRASDEQRAKNLEDFFTHLIDKTSSANTEDMEVIKAVVALVDDSY